MAVTRDKGITIDDSGLAPYSEKAAALKKTMKSTQTQKKPTAKKTTGKKK